MRKLSKKKQFLRNIFPHSKLARRLLYCVIVLSVLGLALFSTLTVKQKSFEGKVYALQKAGNEQMERQLSSTDDHAFKRKKLKMPQPNYFATDVKTLTPEDVEKIDPINQIANYGEGVIDIPDISLHLPILEGMSQANLSIGAGTAKPNQIAGKGNFVLLGHYMTNQGLLFGGLRNIHKRSEINITYKGERVTYEVATIKVIDKSEVHYMEDSKENKNVLTLITCDSSKEGTPNRLMIQANVKE